MQTIYAIILGIIQGITEWLPVSSSGHLAIFQNIFDINVPILYNVLLHVATLLVLFVVFKDDIIKCINALISWDWKSEYGKLNKFIIIGSIPICIFGYFFRNIIESLFGNIFSISIALLITGAVLFLTKFVNQNKKLNIKNSFLIGIAQAFALIPGISRSGITISTGILSGVDKRKVTRFSFLLSIPAIIGAFVFEIGTISEIEIMPSIIGFITSFFVGYVSLRFLLNLIYKNKFWIFAIYCWIIGILLLIL